MQTLSTIEDSMIKYQFYEIKFALKFKKELAIVCQLLFYYCPEMINFCFIPSPDNKYKPGNKWSIIICAPASIR